MEFAFILARPLAGPGVTLFDVLNATDYVVPALELIDARIEQFDRHTKAPRKVLDTIADNAANAGIVPGGRPMRPDAVDWRWAGALLFKNGVIEESGLGAVVLNHPANKLAPYGESLAIGSADLSASMGHLGNPGHADVRNAIDTGIARILSVDESMDRHYISMGARFVAVGVEATILARAIRSLADRFKTTSISNS